MTDTWSRPSGRTVDRAGRATPPAGALENALESAFGLVSDPARRTLPQDHRRGGSFDISMHRGRQPPLDLISPARPEVFFAFGSFTAPGRIVIDTGAGRDEYVADRPVHHMQPHDLIGRYELSMTHEVTTIAVAPTRLNNLLDLHGIRDAPYLRLSERHAVTTPALTRLVDALFAAMAPALPPPSGLLAISAATAKLIADGLTLQLLAHLCDGNAALDPRPEAWERKRGRSGRGRPREDARVARAIEYAEANLHLAVGISDLAGVAALSPAHFARLFKRVVGEAPWAYVHRRRCERAREMCLGGTVPLAQVAHASGFSSQAHMTTALKARFGATPGVMRTEARS